MKRLWVPAALTLALSLCTGYVDAAQAGAATPSVLVTLATLRQGRLPRTVEGYGTAQAPASASRSIAALSAETVEQVFVQDGAEVAAGAPLLRVRPSPETAVGYAQAQSALRVADQLVASTRQMYAQHLATNQQLADAEKSDSDARASLNAFQTEGAGGAKIVRAPFRAVVTHVAATPGALLTAGAPLLDLAKPDALVLKVGVGAADAMLINHGNPVHVSAIGDTRTCAGTVLQRGSMIDPATGLVPVEVTLPAGCLLGGETARASISAGATQGYVVPHAAVLVDGSGAPYIVQADGMKARKVPVRIAATQGDQNVIQGDGLKLAQPVVVSGNYQLDDGMALRLANAGKGAP